MTDTVKLIIEIPKEVKQEFDKTESIALKGAYFDLDGIIGKAIQNGTPLDSNSERAEVQAYFAGQTYGWEQGRKVLIDELEAEIADISTCVDYTAYKVKTRVLDILDNIGKKESEEA